MAVNYSQLSWATTINREKGNKSQSLLFTLCSSGFFTFPSHFKKANTLINPLHFRTNSLLLLVFLVQKVTRQTD